MNFDPNIALQYAASIARPRRVGSGNDEKVAEWIAQRLRSFGYQVDCEPFAFSIAPQLLLALEILLGLMLIAAMFVLDIRARIVPSIVFIAFMLTANPINRKVRSRSVLPPEHQPQPFWKWHTTLSSTNIVATLPDRSEDSSLMQMYLVAHYDSKSQWLPLVLRITLFVLAMTCGLIFSTLNLFGVDALFANPFGFIAFISALPLLLLDTGNESPGAIDNASGVGLVLHLAECLRGTQSERLCNLTILIPGAEEFSLMGSAAYVQLHAEQLDHEAGYTHVLNFDGIGVDGDLRWIGRGGELSDRIQQTCRDLNLKLGRFNMLGALYDHLPFADRGLDAVSLIAISPASRSLHTPKDSIDKLQVRGFDQAGRVALRVIERIIMDFTDR